MASELIGKASAAMQYHQPLVISHWRSDEPQMRGMTKLLAECFVKLFSQRWSLRPRWCQVVPR